MSPTPAPTPVPVPIQWTDVATAWASMVAAGVAVLGLIGLAIAAIEAARTRRAALAANQATLAATQEAVKTRSAGLMADFSRRWDEPLLAQSRRLAGSYAPDRLQRRMEYLINQNHGDADILLRNPNFLEDVAILVEGDALPFEMVRKSLGAAVEDEWNHWEQTILWLRGDEKYDLMYENWEALAKRIHDDLAARGDVPGVSDDPARGLERASGTGTPGGPAADSSGS